ncbi:hypothetical protein Bca4012_084352 [Brassica carinata]
MVRAPSKTPATMNATKRTSRVLAQTTPENIQHGPHFVPSSFRFSLYSQT